MMPFSKLALSLVFLIAIQAAPSFAESQAAEGATQTGLTSGQVDGLQAWINQTRESLQTTLSELASQSVPDAYSKLSGELHGLLERHEPRAENTFAYYSLARALKVDQILSSSGIDLRLSVLWSASEIALNEIQISATNPTRADFGIDYSLFLMASAENALNASAQLELANFALGLLSVDLADDPRAVQFSNASLFLLNYLESQAHAQPRSDADKIGALRLARQAYQNCLGALKGTALDAAVAGTQNPTVEYNRRVLRRNLDSSEIEVQTASMNKLLSLSASEDDQRRILRKLQDPSLTVCSAAYFALKGQQHFNSSLIPDLLGVVTSDRTPRTCRYAAIMLTLKFDHYAMFEPLHQIVTEVVSGKWGLFYPDGQDHMILPMELNFAAQLVVFGGDSEAGNIQQFCSSVLCVGDWVLQPGLFGNKMGPVIQVDDRDRVQTLDSRGKWIERKNYFRRVESLNGLSIGDIAIKKNMPPVVRDLARTTSITDVSASFALRGIRGKVEHLFENGLVVLRDIGPLDMEWQDTIGNLDKL